MVRGRLTWDECLNGFMFHTSRKMVSFESATRIVEEERTINRHGWHDIRAEGLITGVSLGVVNALVVDGIEAHKSDGDRRRAAVHHLRVRPAQVF